MILRPTVFVLGAGASHVYGFPTGAKLVTDVIHSLKYPDTKFSNDVRWASGAEGHLLGEFRRDLREARRRSIDRFLETRQEYLRIGKAAIARTLMPLEVEEELYQPDKEDWYEYLLDHMIQGSSPAAFQRNRLNIITFNFDRSFEAALFKALRASYGGMDDPTAGELSTHIKVFHIHGDLGRFDRRPGSGWARPYTAVEDGDATKAAAERIRLVHEELTPESLELPLTAIEEAQVICFLGFGFDRMNMRRLGFDGADRERLYHRKKIYCTKYDLQDGELTGAHESLKGLDYDFKDRTILQFLRHEKIVHE